MKLRYDGACRLCGASLPAGTEAIYESETKTVRCLQCPTEAMETMSPGLETPREESLSTEPGVAGSSARREYERRKAKDEEKLREKWGRFGGLAVALSDERQPTKAWDRGAVGEERLGARLNALAGDGLAVLHDRRIPGSKANIDHIAITPGGIWVIDAKRYKGRPELRIEGGILRPRVEKLLVGRRDCTKLVDGALKQVDIVRDHVGDVPVTGALCFVEADWPLIGGTFATRDVHVLWPIRLAKVLTDQTAGDVDVAAMRELIASRFKSA
ncbi:NERD domain-containing protein [Pseudarthrobacter sp. RMG13]|uniref:NERD domain-containing protein n=1 Tax=Pseudarthrobacter humi TaxID=2952523 RepID=A0ABT1LPN1_9MICC|nr:nuclease-related domain-containing protein [Pseudarthrobacter humi]MCP8999141.1 NERD domain-containing protein [Pseudarthrobacter humi]